METLSLWNIRMLRRKRIINTANHCIYQERHYSLMLGRYDKKHPGLEFIFFSRPKAQATIS